MKFSKFVTLLCLAAVLAAAATAVAAAAAAEGGRAETLLMMSPALLESQCVWHPTTQHRLLNNLRIPSTHVWSSMPRGRKARKVQRRLRAGHRAASPAYSRAAVASFLVATVLLACSPWIARTALRSPITTKGLPALPSPAALLVALLVYSPTAHASPLASASPASRGRLWFMAGAAALALATTAVTRFSRRKASASAVKPAYRPTPMRPQAPPTTCDIDAAPDAGTLTPPTAQPTSGHEGAPRAQDKRVPALDLSSHPIDIEVSSEACPSPPASPRRRRARSSAPSTPTAVPRPQPRAPWAEPVAVPVPVQQEQATAAADAAVAVAAVLDRLAAAAAARAVEGAVVEAGMGAMLSGIVGRMLACEAAVAQAVAEVVEQVVVAVTAHAELAAEVVSEVAPLVNAAEVAPEVVSEVAPLVNAAEVAPQVVSDVAPLVVAAANVVPTVVTSEVAPEVIVAEVSGTEAAAPEAQQAVAVVAPVAVQQPELEAPTTPRPSSVITLASTGTAKHVPSTHPCQHAGLPTLPTLSTPSPTQLPSCPASPTAPGTPAAAPSTPTRHEAHQPCPLTQLTLQAPVASQGCPPPPTALAPITTKPNASAHHSATRPMTPPSPPAQPGTPTPFTPPRSCPSPVSRPPSPPSTTAPQVVHSTTAAAPSAWSVFPYLRSASHSPSSPTPAPAAPQPNTPPKQQLAAVRTSKPSRPQQRHQIQKHAPAPAVATARPPARSYASMAAQQHTAPALALPAEQPRQAAARVQASASSSHRQQQQQRQKPRWEYTVAEVAASMAALAEPTVQQVLVCHGQAAGKRLEPWLRKWVAAFNAEDAHLRMFIKGRDADLVALVAEKLFEASLTDFSPVKETALLNKRVVVDVPADGHCLYHALAAQLEGTALGRSVAAARKRKGQPPVSFNHRGLRDLACQQLRSQPGLYVQAGMGGFTSDDPAAQVMGTTADVLRQAKRLARGSEWGTQHAMRALGHALQCTVTMVQAAGDVTEVALPMDGEATLGAGLWVHLLGGNHFQALCLLDPSS